MTGRPDTPADRVGHVAGRPTDPGQLAVTFALRIAQAHHFCDGKLCEPATHARKVAHRPGTIAPGDGYYLIRVPEHAETDAKAYLDGLDAYARATGRASRYPRRLCLSCALERS